MCARCNAAALNRHRPTAGKRLQDQCPRPAWRRRRLAHLKINRDSPLYCCRLEIARRRATFSRAYRWPTPAISSVVSTEICMNEDLREVSAKRKPLRPAAVQAFLISWLQKILDSRKRGRKICAEPMTSALKTAWQILFIKLYLLNFVPGSRISMFDLSSSTTSSKRTMSQSQ